MALQPTLARPITFECGGPHVYSYEELLRAVAHEADIQPILIPIPFAAWDALAWTAEFLPGPADYSESGGTDAGRQRIVSADAGIC